MNYIKKSILILSIASLIGNNVFAAGAKVNNATGAIIAFELFTTSGKIARIIMPGKSEAIDAGGFVGIDGAQWLYCGKMYRLNLPKRIEGIETWRDWNLTSDAKQINIGGSGLLASFGLLTASTSAEGQCPCDLGQALRGAIQGQ